MIVNGFGLTMESDVVFVPSASPVLLWQLKTETEKYYMDISIQILYSADSSLESS